MSERKEKFTPGPWRVASRGDKAYHATDTSVVKDVERDRDHQYDLVGICSTAGEWHCDHFEKVANAALIAAAPEMYECICDALTDLEMSNGMRAHFEEVLKKARGEE